MGLHRPFDRHFITLEGSTQKDGYSLALTRGVVGLFDADQQTKDGLPAVSNLAGNTKGKKYVLKAGSSYDGVTRSHNNKNISSIPFTLDQVVAVRASAPQITSQEVDEVVLGYNGVEATTGISFTKGDRKAIFVELCGDYLSYIGYPNGKTAIEYVMEADQCDPFQDCEDCDNCSAVECAPIILKAIEFLKSFQLRGGVPLSEVVDITPVKSCDTAPEFEEEPWDFYRMSVADMGDNVALNLVKAQYSGYKVVRVDRVGIISTYEIVAPQDTVLAAYEQSLASLLKGCEDCPAGYDEVEGGILYAVTLEDNGADETATIQAIPNAAANTAIKYGQVDGVGFYSVVLTAALTSAQVSTFVTANGGSTIDNIGTTATVCKNATVTEATWAVTGTCNVSKETYKITVPDNKCGENRLAELQEIYSDNEVFLSGTFSTALTLTGTSGTATVSFGEEDYTATFATDLTTTASNFVTANAASMLADFGITVTSAAAVLTFTGAIKDNLGVAVVNATGDLAGTVVVTTTPVTGGCQTEYVTTQATNLVCDECDDIYKDYFTSEAPAPFEGAQWEKVENAPAYTGCVCGIRFKGKVLEFHPDDIFLDTIEHLESSVQVQVSGGYITEQREGLGRIIDEPMAVSYLSRWKPRTHAGGNLRAFERQANWYFDQMERGDDLLRRRLLGEETMLDSDTQYATFSIEVRDSGYTQSMGGVGKNTSMIYHLVAPFGKHQNVQDLANLVAAGAGLPAVSV